MRTFMINHIKMVFTYKDRCIDIALSKNSKCLATFSDATLTTRKSEVTRDTLDKLIDKIVSSAIVQGTLFIGTLTKTGKIERQQIDLMELVHNE